MNSRSQNALAHAEAQRQSWASALREQDGEFLQMRDTDKLTFRQIGTRLGISASAARHRLEAVRRREATRARLRESD